jgi:hypothetical protein
MQVLEVISLTENVYDWLENSCHPRILHIFDRVCSLINECGEVLSIVPPGIGNGPFNLVVEEGGSLFKSLTIESPVSMIDARLHIGNLTLNTAGGKYWSPRPDWEGLYENRDIIASQLAALPVLNSQSPRQLTGPLSLAFAERDVSTSKAIASRLAGLGAGLTPAGDDFLMGALYAAWILHPLAQAEIIAKEVADTAAPLTTSLSAAWLRSAGRGEAGALWHQYFEALALSNATRSQAIMEKIMAVGATSGMESLAGFHGVFQSYREIGKKYVLPRVV